MPSIIREDDGDLYCHTCGHSRLDSGGTMALTDVEYEDYPGGLDCAAGCGEQLIEPDEDWCAECERLMATCLEMGCQGECCGYEPEDAPDDGRCRPGTCSDCDAARESEAAEEDDDDEDEPPAPAPETPDEAALELALREAVQA